MPSVRLLIFFALASVAGYAASLVGVPLAWMIGPMLLAAGMAISGRTVALPRRTRPVGQLIVATAVGLYFTPAALTELLAHLPYMVAAAVATVAAGCATALVMVRLARTDAATALFSCVPGGPVEMAQLADQARGDATSVAAAQSLRISMIVLTIPPVLKLTAGSEFGAYTAGGYHASAVTGTLVLLAAAIAAGLAFRRLRIASPFFLGPLAASALLAAADIHVFEFPWPLIAAGQVLLGVSQGMYFDREFLRSAPRFMAASLLTTVLLLAGCTALAWTIATAMDRPLAAMVLAAAPGSVTEMALTAEALGLGVAGVTAFQMVRLFIVLPVSPVLLRLLLWRSRS